MRLSCTMMAKTAYLGLLATIVVSVSSCRSTGHPFEESEHIYELKAAHTREALGEVSFTKWSDGKYHLAVIKVPAKDASSLSIAVPDARLAPSNWGVLWIKNDGQILPLEFVKKGANTHFPSDFRRSRLKGYK